MTTKGDRPEAPAALLRSDWAAWARATYKPAPGMDGFVHWLWSIGSWSETREPRLWGLYEEWCCDNCLAPVRPDQLTFMVRSAKRQANTRKLAALTDLTDMLEAGLTIPTHHALAKRWKVSRPSVTAWMRDWERRGEIECRRVGTANEIVAADRPQRLAA